MNIILADSHGPVLGKDQNSANLSLLYLASYLRSKMPDVSLQYISQKPPAEYHIDAIKTFNASIYAASFTSYSAPQTYKLIRQIKEGFPRLLVVIGGAHVNTHSKDALEKSGADICVIGEGEITFHEIVQRYNEIPECLESIKGIAYIKNGIHKMNPSRPIIDDIDTVPFPSRDLVNQADFVGLTYSKARPNTEMVVTRGCPFRCVFCANPVYRLDNGPLFRSRSPENIAMEAEQLYQMGYREIYIHSDELNVDLKWSIDVCKALAGLGHRDLYFQCNLRVVPMSEEFAYWLSKANFWMVRIGFESASERVLKGIKKKMSFEKTDYACELLSKHNVKVFAYLMLFNFWEEDGVLHHENPDEIQSTIRSVYRLWRQRKLTYSSWTFAVPVQGAELYDIARKHGMVDDDYYPSDTWNAYEHLRGVSKKEFNSLYAKARRQTGIMALTAGHFEWRNYRRIARNAMTMVRGIPN